MTEQPIDPGQHSADEVQTRPFADFFREVNKGKSHREMSEALQDLVAAVDDTGKAGKLTLTIKVATAGPGQVVVTDEIKLKKPEQRAASLFFCDDAYNLRRDDPNQPTLPLVAAVPDSTDKPLRKAD